MSHIRAVVADNTHDALKYGADNASKLLDLPAVDAVLTPQQKQARRTAKRQLAFAKYNSERHRELVRYTGNTGASTRAVGGTPRARMWTNQYGRDGLRTSDGLIHPRGGHEVLH